MDRTTADMLAASLRKASQDYYSTGASDMSDAEYDDGVANLKRQYPDDYTDLYENTVANGVDIDTDDVVIHRLPMMSLAKAYTLDDVRKYVRKLIKHGATGFRFQPKLDGMSCSALYVNGVLRVISSRGNGTEGRDMSYLIHNHDVTIRNMPESIDTPYSSVEVRGELLLTYSDYEHASNLRRQSTGKAFESYRNANAGIANGAKLGLGYHAYLTFIAYRLIIDSHPHDDEASMSSLNAQGFLTSDAALKNEWTDAPELVVDRNAPFSDMEHIIDEYGKVKDDFNIPNDGIVIKPVNEDDMDKAMGSTAHHPSSQLAFKYVGERITVDVIGMEWSVGKQGHLTPTLVYKPATLGTTTNDRATFHNASYVHEYNIAKGSKVIIEWAGKVIPKFIDVVSTPHDAERFKVPEYCPSCHGRIVMKGRMATCPNMECPSRNDHIFKAAVSRSNLDIKTMGDSIIDACISEGLLTDIPSLFRLDENALANLHQESGRVVGRKTASTIMKHIEKARHLPFERVVSSLAIPGLGVRKAGFISEAGVRTIRELSTMSADELRKIERIGSENAKAISEWFGHHESICDDLASAGVECVDHDTSGKNDESDQYLHGMSFSISGSVPSMFSNRDDFIDFITSHGGKFSASPNADTDYMIGDASSSSSKIRKALRLHTTIVSPDMFEHVFMKNGQHDKTA